MFDRRLSLPAIILSAISSTCICRETHARGRLLRAMALVAVLLGLCAAGAHAGPTDTTTTLQITSGGSEVTTVVWGSEVTLTAAVTSGGGQVTGQVNFCDALAPHCTDIHLLGTAQLTPQGAVLRFHPGIGEYSYIAVYAGTPQGSPAFKPSSSLSATLAVTGKYPTTTAITAVTGATPPYSITATVTGFGGNTSPAGTVSFLDATDSNSQLGSASLASATFVQSFAAKAPYATEEGPTYVAVGDFDEDGIPDLAVANNNSSSVSVLLGKGDGTFKVQIAYATGTAPASVAVGDFNGDGIPDLAVANLGSNNVSVLLGKGDGTFKAQVAYATGTAPFSVAVGDFNGDGIADLAVANSSDNTVSILLGKGDGAFNTQVAYATGSHPYSVAVGDLNKDGIADLAIANLWDNDVSVLLGNGDGTFRNQVTYAAQTGPTAVAVGDFNGDGIPDLAVTNCGSGGSCAGDGPVSVYLGNGDGTFQTQATYVTGSNPASIAVGDFNGDGIADLATANAVDNNVSVLLGNGDGTFKAQVIYPTGNYPLSIAVGSFNGDGIPDLAVANANDNAVSVLLGAATNTATGANTWSAGVLTHQVVATYPGSALYTGSTSAPASLPEHKIATTLTLTASPDYSIVGSQVTLTATLSPYAAQATRSAVVKSSRSRTARRRWVRRC